MKKSVRINVHLPSKFSKEDIKTYIVNTQGQKVDLECSVVTNCRKCYRSIKQQHAFCAYCGNYLHKTRRFV